MDDAAVGAVDVLPGEVEAAPGEEAPDVGAVLVVPDEPVGVTGEVLGAVEVPAVVLVVGLLDVPGVLGLGDVDRGVLVEG